MSLVPIFENLRTVFGVSQNCFCSLKLMSSEFSFSVFLEQNTTRNQTCFFLFFLFSIFLRTENSFKSRNQKYHKF